MSNKKNEALQEPYVINITKQQVHKLNDPHFVISRDDHEIGKVRKTFGAWRFFPVHEEGLALHEPELRYITEMLIELKLQDFRVSEITTKAREMPKARVSPGGIIYFTYEDIAEKLLGRNDDFPNYAYDQMIQGKLEATYLLRHDGTVLIDTNTSDRKSLYLTEEKVLILDKSGIPKDTMDIKIFKM